MTMAPKPSVDAAFTHLCKNSAVLNHRSLIILRGNDIYNHIVILHHFLYKESKLSSVLWCHKKDAPFIKASQKSKKKTEKLLKCGKADISSVNGLDVLLQTAVVTFCCYNDSLNALGNTYGMCVLQDPECLTPNLLCRLVETVSGGGMVILLLNGMSHLSEFCLLDMNAHYRLSTFSHPVANKIFNPRFVISLSSCRSCLVMDENLNLCPDEVINLKEQMDCSIQPPGKKSLMKLEEHRATFEKLLKDVADCDKPIPQLMQLCKTEDQGKALLKLVDVVTERCPGSVVSVTASRGRGKSAVLGLAVVASIDLGLNNIFVTSPSPHNLTAFFELLFAGFDALGYVDGKDYTIIQSTNPEFSGAIVSVSVFKEYRQNIQYVLPSDYAAVRQAELVVIDEAAAIPLPQVQQLLQGQHIVLLSSTIAGYEGTGRSLSLKLLKELRRQSTQVDRIGKDLGEIRQLHEVSLAQSIRYESNDPIEQWLTELLCLDATNNVPTLISYPVPEACSLYYVDKRVLFSGTKASERILQQMQALLVASHYRNSPDDLQALADAPAHHLFVLFPPLRPNVDGQLDSLPSVLCVLQVCLEGRIPASRCRNALKRGERPAGDLLPWTLASQYQCYELASIAGVRVVRIATHPDCQNMGYGSRALKELCRYYRGEFVDLVDGQPPVTIRDPVYEPGQPIYPQHAKEQLLYKLSSRIAEPVDYVGVAYGITPQLFRFWSKSNFHTVYISQALNKTTGEHSCMMVHPITPSSEASSPADGQPLPEWLSNSCTDFMRRLLMLLAGPLRSLPPSLANDLIHYHLRAAAPNSEVRWKEIERYVNGHDLRRLEKYSQRVVDRHLITDIVSSVALLYGQQKLADLQLSKIQTTLLIGVGLQNKDLIEVGTSIGLTPDSTLGNFNRTMTRVFKVLQSLQETAFASKLKSVVPELLIEPIDITVNQDLEKIAKEAEQEMPELHFKKRKRNSLLDGDVKNTKGKKKRNKYPKPF